MEKESFEDTEVAKTLNDSFISIKVDREERPDIDSIYMDVCQSITGSGGWPLTIIMTPEQKPFFAGTYFPKNSRDALMGLMSILDYIKKAWKNNRDELLNASTQILDFLKNSKEPSNETINEDIFQKTFLNFKYDFDPTYGGFGDFPKFPSAHNLLFLLRYFYKTKDSSALEMVEKTLDCMKKGGIYDHIGFGFSRYSVDRKWLVPHFEKMLYDNALLIIAYIETFQATGNKKYCKTAEEILSYVLRDMTSKEGGFYSAEDADSEGEEGKFYVWSEEEIKNILQEEDGSKFCSYFNITKGGNFEGKNILNLINSSIPEDDMQFIENCREKLFAEREKRIHPYKDDKILTSWNGLMIAAMSIAGRVLNNSKYTKAAKKAVDFIYKNLVRSDGRLLARYRDGEASFLGYLDDYSFLIWGLIELYETTYSTDYLKKALELNEDLLKLFWDKENGGFFLYGNDGEKLITRPKEIYDSAIPSGNSTAALNLLRLSHLTSSYDFEDKAKQLFETFSKELNSFPRACSFSLIALLFSKSPIRQIIVSAGSNIEEGKQVVHMINEKFNPFTISILYCNLNKDLSTISPIIENYIDINNKTTTYICENFTCKKPITDINLLNKIL